jgi:amphi-Trp domain-containing protein
LGKSNSINQNSKVKEKEMGIETVLFKSEEKKSSQEISGILRKIADKIDSGTMTLQQGADEIVVTFPNHMVLELKVEEEQGKKLKKSFEIELEWVPGEDQTGGTKII